MSPRAERTAADGARTVWRHVYDTSLEASKSQAVNWGPDGAGANDATEIWFRNSAAGVIQAFHQNGGEAFAPLPISQTGVEGHYRASPAELRSLETVKNRFDAFR